jgi:phospholipid/cholesterol/gamma-HCH transport system substrate-binding protein
MLKTLTVTNENAALLTEDLLKITRQINNGKGSIGVLLKDEQVALMLRETMVNLKNASRETTSILSKVNALVSDFEKNNTTIGVLRDSVVARQLRQIVGNVNQVSIKLKNTTQQIDSMTHQYKNSRSALNYIATESAARDKIDSVLTHLNNAGKLLEEDLKALQGSFLLRGYFKKKEKEKEKEKTTQTK